MFTFYDLSPNYCIIFSNNVGGKTKSTEKLSRDENSFFLGKLTFSYALGTEHKSVTLICVLSINKIVRGL